MPVFKELNYKSIHRWCVPFLFRQELTLWKVTHIGHEVKDNASELIMKFIKDIKQKIIDYDINDKYN